MNDFNELPVQFPDLAEDTLTLQQALLETGWSDQDAESLITGVPEGLWARLPDELNSMENWRNDPEHSPHPEEAAKSLLALRNLYLGHQECGEHQKPNVNQALRRTRDFLSNAGLMTQITEIEARSREASLSELQQFCSAVGSLHELTGSLAMYPHRGLTALGGYIQTHGHELDFNAEAYPAYPHLLAHGVMFGMISEHMHNFEKRRDQMAKLKHQGSNSPIETLKKIRSGQEWFAPQFPLTQLAANATTLTRKMQHHGIFWQAFFQHIGEPDNAAIMGKMQPQWKTIAHNFEAIGWHKPVQEAEIIPFRPSPGKRHDN